MLIVISYNTRVKNVYKTIAISHLSSKIYLKCEKTETNGKVINYLE